MVIKFYAAYGSNMNTKQMRQRCPQAKVAGSGFIDNYKLTFCGNNFSGVANIEYVAGASVPVVLWKLTAACERALDIYEGYPSLYTKKWTTVRLANGKMVGAMVYILTPKYAGKLAEPGEYYYQIIAQGYEEHSIPLDALDTAYVDAYKKCKNSVW